MDQNLGIRVGVQWELPGALASRGPRHCGRLRVLVGIGRLSLVFVGPKTAWGWIGILPLLTGFTGLCLLYTVLGISTRPKKAST